MSSKVLKILIALEGGEWFSPMELAKRTNYTVVEIGVHLKVLRRLDFVEKKPRTTINGERIPPAYKSKIKKID